MDNLRILVVGDVDVVGSGYREIITNLCTGLHDAGHEVKVIGLNYNRTEHFFPFSMIPVQNFSELIAAVTNALFLWKPQILITAIDIPQQLDFLKRLKPKADEAGTKWIAIVPLENGPLCSTWAFGLALFNRVLFISQLGCDEARKTGLRNVEHIRIGVNTDLWKPAVEGEKQTVRKNLGYDDKDFLIITVADNQERKNLSASMKIISKLLHGPMPHVKYMLVTREHNPYGWKLRDLAMRPEYDISNEMVITERGLSAPELRLLYIASDAFLLASKAEGLGMPVLEAMACGIPTILTDTGALHEVGQNRAYLISSAYTFDDVWGNSKRDMIDVDEAVKIIHEHKDNFISVVYPALKYVQERTWQNTVSDMLAAIAQVLQ